MKKAISILFVCMLCLSSVALADPAPLTAAEYIENEGRHVILHELLDDRAKSA